MAALERAPEELLDVLMRDIAADFLLHVELPAEHLLVGETLYNNEHVIKSERYDEAYPCRGPARAKSAAE